MRVQVDADAGPTQPRRDLLDMARLAGAMIALHHDAPVIGKARQNRERGIRVEHIGGVEIGHPLVRLGKGRDFHININAEHFPRIHLTVGRGQQRL